MNKKLFAIIVLILLATFTFADHTRLGFIAGLEFEHGPSCDQIVDRYQARSNVLPGFYIEVIPDHIGYGITAQALFDRQDSLLPEVDYQWTMDWIGSLDFRFHPFRWAFFDPFLEFGLGSAGKVDITDYEEYGLEEATAENPLNLSIFTQVGWGLGFRLGSLNFGARMVYRIWAEPPPGTHFEPYPLEDFHFDLFGGFRI